MSEKNIPIFEDTEQKLSKNSEMKFYQKNNHTENNKLITIFDDTFASQESKKDFCT